MQIEIEIVNMEAATQQNTLLHAQYQLCMVTLPLNKAVWCVKKKNKTLQRN